MTPLSDNLYSAQQSRQIEQLALARYNLSGYDLMQRAAMATADYLKQRWPHARRLLIVVGAGNNGGDGYALARIVGPHYDTVTLRCCAPISPSSPDEAKKAYDDFLQAGLSVNIDDGSLPEADLIIDALWGIGLNRGLSKKNQQLISKLNQHSAPILALDIASGLFADSGHCAHIAIRANVTLSFISKNLGLYTAHGPDHSGEIVLADLGLPHSLYAEIVPLATCCQLTNVAPTHMTRHQASHKGQFGHVLAIGGDKGLAGAIQMTALAAARTGAGLTTIATHPSHANQLTSRQPELMCYGIEAPEQLAPLLDAATVLAIGPGLKDLIWATTLVTSSVASGKPMVIDAGALVVLEKQAIHCSSSTILTPHPGEAAQLLNLSSQQVQADRVQAVQQIQQRYGGVVVLKGAGTLIYDGQQLQLCPYGNPGMASAGMGDLLTGIIASLVAQGIPPYQAACYGVTLHALAGDRAAKTLGEIGLLALDLIPYLRQLRNSGTS